jgi:hypothetical protein
MRFVIRLAAALSLATAVGACGGGDTFEPTVETVAGSYTATTFTTTSPVGTINLLSLGATLTLSLDADGTTTGQLFVPNGAEDGSDLDADLAGTWSLTGSTVTFDQAADTFIPDVEFTAERDRLTGQDTFSGATIRLVLSKTEA